MAVTQLTEEMVLAALGTVKDPELHRGMIELKMIQDVILVDPRTVAMRVVLTTPACPLKNRIHDDIDAALATLPGAPKADIKWDAQVSRTGSIPQKQQLEGVKNVASESPPAPSILRSPSPNLAPEPVSWTPTSTGRTCPFCWGRSTKSRTHRTKRSFPSSATASRS